MKNPNKKQQEIHGKTTKPTVNQAEKEENTKELLSPKTGLLA